MAGSASHHGRVGLLYTRRGSEQDNEGGAEREHIHVLQGGAAVGWKKVVIEEKPHSIRRVGFEGEVNAGAESEASSGRNGLAGKAQFWISDIAAEQFGTG